METIAFKKVVDGVLHLAGIDPDEAQDSDILAIAEAIADRLEFAHTFYRWPQYQSIEQRYFRPAWDAATAYADGDEVYFADEDAYYAANQATSAGESPTTHAAKWDVLETYRRTVDYEQAGQTAIGAVTRAWDRDPLSVTTALEVDFSVRADGIVLPATYARTSVWLEVVARAPDAHAELYDAAAAYVVGDIVYFPTVDGQVYTAAQATSAGETPLTHAAKWTLVEIPRFLGPALKAGAYADWLTSDERPNAAAAWEQRFTELLDEEVWQLTKLQGQTGRVRVSLD